MWFTEAIVKGRHKTELYIYFRMYNLISLSFDQHSLLDTLMGHTDAILFGLFSNVVRWFSKLVKYRGFMLCMFRRHLPAGVCLGKQIIPEFYLWCLYIDWFTSGSVAGAPSPSSPVVLVLRSVLFCLRLFLIRVLCPLKKNSVLYCVIGMNIAMMSIHRGLVCHFCVTVLAVFLFFRLFDICIR